MAKLSTARAGWPILPGLKLMSRGKVRDTYVLENGRLLVVATDGISIFDFVLNALIPEKGIILTAMNHFWMKYIAEFGFKTHFIAAGADVDQYLPKNLRGNTDLQSRAIVVERLNMAPVEFIFRTCLTGSGLTSYKESGRVYGHQLPPGIQDGDQLPYLLFTPTDKSEEGHDKPISVDNAIGALPRAVYNLANIVQVASAYAESCGIKLADTKFEGSAEKVGDEVLTPDSSRYWDLREWLESRKPREGRKPPAPYDKQLVRIFGIENGTNKLDPENPDDVAKAHALVVPKQLLAQTTQVYRYILWRLAKMTSEQYRRRAMGINVSDAKSKRVVIICGSDTDLPQVKGACTAKPHWETIPKHIISCHRNPEALMEFVRDLEGVDVIVGYGGKAFAQPGIADAWAHHFKKDVRVVGVASGEPGSKALLAAQLSIDELPGQPVIMDEITGQVYTGPSGLQAVLERIENGELPPPKPRKAKPFMMNV